jgi:two-component system chemotaxis sensor kinase CheA
MNGNDKTALLEEIASLVVMAEPSDPKAMTRLHQMLQELLTWEPVAQNPSIRQSVEEVTSSLGTRVQSGSPTSNEELAAISQVVTHVQQSLQSNGAEPGADANSKASGKFVLPDVVDEATFPEFLATLKLTLEKIEGDILALEEGDRERLGEILRKIHTLKGESGLIGMTDLSEVCHALETYLGKPGTDAAYFDRLFQTKDWMFRALEAYTRFELPDPRGESIAKPLREPLVSTPEPPPATSSSAKAADQPVAKVAASATTPDASCAQTPRVQLPTASVKVERDQETIDLIMEFLQESEEGLSAADQALLNIEQDGNPADKINSIFRAFHTIKGVAGFLDLTEIATLAHITETLLNLLRQKTIELNSSIVDVVLDATAAMRRLLTDLHVAVEEQRTLNPDPGLEPLIRDIEAMIRGENLAPRQGEQPAAKSRRPPAAVAQKPSEVSAPQQNTGASKPLPSAPAPLPVQTTRPAEAREAAAVETPDEPTDTGDTTFPAATQDTPAPRNDASRRVDSVFASNEAVAPKVPASVSTETAANKNDDSASRVKVSETVRIDLERVDSLLAMIGELVIAEAMVVHSPEIAALSSPSIRNYISQLSKICRDLQDVGMRMRMVPVRGVFQKMNRMVRDLSRKSGKQVRIVLSGEATEIDRSMVEQISDPLVHMIRNSMDHGIENAEERKRVGKPAEGAVSLSAYHHGGCIVIELRDDGKGLDKEAILNKATAQGLIKAGSHMSEDEIFNLIFLPGFSTAKKVTEISGRGVGMDVVRRNVEAMRGRVQISSVQGQGAIFRMILPLTLAIIDGMLISCGQERYIIPTLSIVESIKPETSMCYTLGDTADLINVRGEILPLYRLDRLFGISSSKSDLTQALVVIVESMGKKVGLVVDEVLTQQQVVIKNLGPKFQDAKHLSGAAILSDGHVGLIINVDEICGLLAKEPKAISKVESIRTQTTLGATLSGPPAASA